MKGKKSLFLPSIHARISPRAIDISTSDRCRFFILVYFRMVVSRYWGNWIDGVERGVATR